MIGSLGWMEIAIILILALLVVGPKGLPKLGKGIGRAIRDFKREASELKDAVDFEIDEDDRKDELRKKKRKKKKVATAGEKPAGEKPAGEKPASEKPASEKPASEKPAGEKPASESPKPEPSDK